MSTWKDAFRDLGKYRWIYDGDGGVRIELTESPKESPKQEQKSGVKERLLTILNQKIDCGKRDGTAVSNVEIADFLIASGITFTDTEEVK